MPNTVTNDQIISATYVALFQRSPDQAGLKFWQDAAAALQLQGKTGVDLAIAMSNKMAVHPAFTTIYSNLGDAAFIDAIYVNVGGKPADAAGRAFWLGKLTDATNPFTRADLVGEFINTVLSISPADLQAQKDAGKITADELTAAVARQDSLTNKADVALTFTKALGAASNLAASTNANDLASLQQDPAYLASKAIIAGVTEVDSTMTTPKTYLGGTPTLNGVITNFGSTSNEGQTFTLTTGVDNIQGTSGNDTILGVADAGATSNQNTLNAADVVNGGAGTDSLMATLDVGSGGVLPSAQYSNIENFFIRNVSGIPAVNTFNFANVAGEEQVWNDRSTFGSTVIVTGLAAGTTVGVKGANTVVAATNATYVATATEAKLALDGGLAATAGGGATGAVTVNGAGLTSAKITSTGGVNNIAALTLVATVTSLTVDATSAFAINDGNTLTPEGITAAGLTSITAKGAGAINLGSAAIGATVTTVNAADNTGGVTAVLNAGQTNIKFTGGAGNDVVTTNGAGDAGGNLLATAVVDAGAGTADRLVIAATADILNAGAVTSKARGDLYKGFEQVQVQSGQALDVDLLSTNNTIDTIRINDSVGVTSVTNLSAAQAANVTIMAGANSTLGAITIGVKGAGTSGQIDTVKAAVQTTTAAGAAVASDLTAIALTGVEKLELTGSNVAIATNVGQVTLTTTAATSLDSIKLNNANAVNTTTADNNVITIAAGQTATNLVIDATGSGDTTIDASLYAPAASATSGVKIIGGAGNDIIIGSGRADDITLGGGSDTVQLSANGNTAGTAANAIVVDTINDFVFGVGGDVLDASILANSLRPVLSGNVSATTVTALNAALPTVGANGIAELIVLDSSIAALQAGNAVALNALNFNLAGAANQGQVLVAYAASASGDVHLASATITGGDITNVVDLAVLKGVTTATIGSGFAANNLTGFQAAGLNLTITAATLVTGGVQDDIFTAANSAAFNAANVVGGGGTDRIAITGAANTVTIGDTAAGGTLTGTFGTLTLQGGTVAGQTVTLANTLTNMNVVASAASSVNLGTGAGNSFAASTGADTVVFSATPGAGVNLTGLNAADTVSTTATVDLSSVQAGGVAGAATGAGTLNMLTNGTTATMTAAQHNGFSTITAAGGNDSITLNTVGTVVGNAAIENYSVVAGSTFTLGAVAQNVTETAAGNTTVNLNGLTSVGNFAAFEAGDVLRVTATGDVKGVNSAAALGMDTLDFNNTNAVTLTLTEVQHEALTTVNNTTNTQTLEVTTIGPVTARAGIENYNLSGAVTNAITVNALTTGVNITGAAVAVAGAKTVIIGGNTVTGTWSLADTGNADVLSATDGANIVGVNGGAATTAETLTLVGGITMKAAQFAVFNAAVVTAAGASDSVTLTDSAAHGVINAAFEGINFNGAGVDTATFALANGAALAGSVAVSLAGGGADIITISNTSIDTGTKVINITGFAADDKIITTGAAASSGIFSNDYAGGALGVNTHAVIEVNATTFQLGNLTNAAAVLTWLNTTGVTSNAAGGDATIVVYDGAGKAGIYQVLENTGGAGTAFDIIELIGTVNAANNTLAGVNFA